MQINPWFTVCALMMVSCRKGVKQQNSLWELMKSSSFDITTVILKINNTARRKWIALIQFDSKHLVRLIKDQNGAQNKRMNALIYSSCMYCQLQENYIWHSSQILHFHLSNFFNRLNIYKLPNLLLHSMSIMNSIEHNWRSSQDQLVLACF